MRTLSFSKILVPVDFSERSEEAARYANQFAAHFQSELILLHVVEPVQFGYAMVEPLPRSAKHLAETNRTAAKQRLDAFAASNLSGVRLRTIVSEGDAAERIVDCSMAENVSLLIMPTQGRSRLRRYLIGSVTAKVLHDSECPVLTGCHLQETPDFPDLHPKKIICAVDLERQTETVLKWGGRLAEEFHASLTVMNVVPNAAGLDQEQRTCLERRLSKMTGGAGLDAKHLIDFGEPYKAVAAEARRSQAELLIIGRGSNDSRIGRLRAQAYHIVRQSPCPVLSV